MGGSRSGRQGGRPTIEATASYILSAAVLKQLSPSSIASASGSFTYAGGFKVDFRFDGADTSRPYIELRHAIRAQDDREIRYRVGLTATHPPYGGSRWWWICPRTGRRAFKLYLPLGGSQFWSREAYGLDYTSQREAPRDRLFRRARKLRLPSTPIAGHGTCRSAGNGCGSARINGSSARGSGWRGTWTRCSASGPNGS